MSGLAAALAKAQASFPAIEKTKTVRVKTRTGGTYTFKYAPLDDVLHGLRPILNENGLALSQLLSMTPDGRPALRTLLLHEGGETLEDVCPLPVNGGESAQEIGSAITYLRRYAVVSLLGIATEEDDDGNAASGNTRSGADTTATARENAEPTSGEADSTPAPDTSFKAPTGKRGGGADVLEKLRSELVDLVTQLGAVDSLQTVHKHADQADVAWLKRQIKAAKASLAQKEALPFE